MFYFLLLTLAAYIDVTPFGGFPPGTGGTGDEKD